MIIFLIFLYPINLVLLCAVSSSVVSVLSTSPVCPVSIFRQSIVCLCCLLAVFSHKLLLIKIALILHLLYLYASMHIYPTLCIFYQFIVFASIPFDHRCKHVFYWSMGNKCFVYWWLLDNTGLLGVQLCSLQNAWSVSHSHPHSFFLIY